MPQLPPRPPDGATALMHRRTPGHNSKHTHTHTICSDYGGHYIWRNTSLNTRYLQYQPVVKRVLEAQSLTQSSREKSVTVTGSKSCGCYGCNTPPVMFSPWSQRRNPGLVLEALGNQASPQHTHTHTNTKAQYVIKQNKTYARAR